MYYVLYLFNTVTMDADFRVSTSAANGEDPFTEMFSGTFDECSRYVALARMGQQHGEIIARLQK